jgi:hypothetical protein
MRLHLIFHPHLLLPPPSGWLHGKIKQEMVHLQPVVPPDLTGFTKVTTAQLQAHLPLSVAHFNLTVDPTTGGIVSLVTTDNGSAYGKEWVDAAEPMFQFLYKSNNQKDDFTAFRANYTQVSVPIATIHMCVCYQRR